MGIERVYSPRESVKRVLGKTKLHQKGIPVKMSKEDAAALRKKIGAEKVFKILSILSKQIEPKYNSKPRNYWKLNIHKKPGTKYYNLFWEIFEYLYELRGDFANPMDGLIHNYLDCVYLYYSEFGRVPYLTQLRPFASNQVRFEEWIYDWVVEHSGDEYWASGKEIHDKHVSEQAKAIVKRRSKLDFFVDPDIVEVGR